MARLSSYIDKARLKTIRICLCETLAKLGPSSQVAAQRVSIFDHGYAALGKRLQALSKHADRDLSNRDIESPKSNLQQGTRCIQPRECLKWMFEAELTFTCEPS